MADVIICQFLLFVVEFIIFYTNKNKQRKMRDRIPRSGCKMLAHKRNKPTYIYGLAARAAAGSFDSPCAAKAIGFLLCCWVTGSPARRVRRRHVWSGTRVPGRPRWPEVQPHGLLAAVSRPAVSPPWTSRSSIASSLLAPPAVKHFSVGVRPKSSGEPVHMPISPYTF